MYPVLIAFVIEGVGDALVDLLEKVDDVEVLALFLEALQRVNESLAVQEKLDWLALVHALEQEVSESIEASWLIRF